MWNTFRMLSLGNGRLWGRVILFLFFLVFLLVGADTPALSDNAADIEVFVREGCSRCAAAKPFLAQLQRERPALRITFHDIEKDQQALARLRMLTQQHGTQSFGVPTFLVKGELIVGYRDAETTGARLTALLTPAQTTSEAVSVPLLGSVSVQDIGLPLFTIVLGLLDGFNPCAMWMLLFLLSLLVNLHDRVKMLIVGGTFVVVSGVIYFAFMVAWLNAFLLIGLSRTVQIGLGSIAILIGTVSLKDFFAFGHGVSLSIPAGVKPGLYARVRRIIQAEDLAQALLSVIVLAGLVNLVELLCTAGLPALYTQILSLHQLSILEYYSYLGLYNVAYILDDSLVLILVVLTLGHRKLQEREGRWLKLVSGGVMCGLGVVLIVAPGWLVSL